MQVEKMIINSKDLTDLGIYLTDVFKVEYSKSGKDYFVIAFEDFFLRTNSKQLELIIATREGNHIEIDVIGAGGGSGLFGITFGSEKAFIKRFERIIEEYKHEKGIVD